MREFLQHATALAERGVMFVTITLVEPEGHVPQDIGAKAIVTETGLCWGTVGGGRLEARAIVHAQEMLARESAAARAARATPPELVRYELLRDLNMVCGGAATLFYEITAPIRWKIAVFGAGHVAQATVALLSTFACSLTCVDPRQEWIARIEECPNLRKVCALNPPDIVATFAPDTFYLCISQGHATDLPIVREILRRGDAAFVGVIGSEPKARTLRTTLLKEGFAESIVAAIRCPVGLAIGSNSPAEIAVSIAAQLLQERDAPRMSTT
ncbi:MAG: xanthine dehydrogenase accessory protein XdhC [Phycisphaerales bacterium]|nr:xanthine dehydrogenase accessory protein XdhC [Phycisphaerales bacterium]